MSTTIRLPLVRKHENTILLGYSIAHADLEDGRRLDIIASGRTVRFRLSDTPGAVDLDIGPAADAAIALLTGVDPEPCSMHA